MIILALIIGSLLLSYSVLKLIEWCYLQKTVVTFCRWAGPDLLTDRKKQAEFFWFLRRLGIARAGTLRKSKPKYEKAFQQFIYEVLHGKLTTIDNDTEQEDKVRANP